MPLLLAKEDWRGLAEIYYGQVAGLEAYVAELYSRAAGIRAKAQAAGFDW